MLERALFGGAVLLFLMGYVQSAEQLVLLRFIQGAVTGTIAAANALIAAIAPWSAPATLWACFRWAVGRLRRRTTHRGPAR